MSDTNFMDWNRLISTQRCGAESSSKDGRSAFQRDIDRILFCDPFHRLARKTQVHPLNENDHIHSRLTHSLETSSVGRSLGEGVGLFLGEELSALPGGVTPHHIGQIVQAACLAHDIGNPPFGHSGETAIKNWFKSNPSEIKHIHNDCKTDFTKFDGNAMSVRVLVNTGFYGQGMSPTHSVLGALLKYPWPSKYEVGKDKFSFFNAEKKQISEMAESIGLIKFDDHYARHPLAYLTEAADDICYRIIDIEDAIELGIIPESFMFDCFACLLKDLGVIKEHKYKACKHFHFRQRNGYIRAKLINHAIKEMVTQFKKMYDQIMSGNFSPKSSLMESSGLPVCSSLLDVYESIEERLFLSRRKAVIELGAQHSIGILLTSIMNEVIKFCTDAPSSSKDKIKILLGKDLIDSVQEAKDCSYQVTMIALDYITGMSDHYATDMCRKFTGMGY